MSGAVPQLRFPGFAGEWPSQPLGDFIDEYREKSIIQDQHEVLTSARSGIVRQRDYFESDRLSERDNVGFNIIPPGFITYRSRSDDRRFYFNRNDLGITGIISIFYPVFRLIGCDPKFFTALLDRYVDEIGKYSVGTSQTVLSLNQLRKISLPLPTLVEQTKIGSILGTVDAKLEALRRKKSGLEAFKSGLMQRLFSQTLRFTRDDGTDFPDWEEKALSDVLFEHRRKSAGDEPVFSVSVHRGLVDQVEHLGRSFAAASTDHYNRVLPGDIVYTKSPTGDFPMGIIKQSHADRDVIVSPLYGVFTPQTRDLGFILHCYFQSSINTANYLSPLVQKGAKNTIAVTNARFLEGELTLPTDPDEQRKIADALSALDAKIAAVADQITHMEAFKKGLLQQMFV